MPPVGKAARLHEPAAPLDGVDRQGFDQQPAQCATINFGLGRADRARPVEQDVAIPVNNTLGILAREREGKKRIVEARGFQPELTVVFVDVQQTALRSRVR